VIHFGSMYVCSARWATNAAYHGARRQPGVEELLLGAGVRGDQPLLQLAGQGLHRACHTTNYFRERRGEGSTVKALTDRLWKCPWWRRSPFLACCGRQQSAKDGGHQQQNEQFAVISHRSHAYIHTWVRSGRCFLQQTVRVRVRVRQSRGEGEGEGEEERESPRFL
jgi:hypothetical protein